MQNRYTKGFKFNINEWKKIANANGQKVYDLLKRHNFEPELFKNADEYYQEVDNDYFNDKPASND
ncbi:hypothetical protein [Shimazuella alba]|uniref:Uncharacterized protein n=1 Tax=Shimazuella alba TaxID=2690964 RepID=A0A6I4VSE9_9BACL|nr:hypothetical protein [Shimazuella alba]MXQ53155.1 hypothetical protein [Shimazuella alba]